MTWAETAALVMTVLGGLGLFIFAMGLMSEGLRQAAGTRLRGLLRQATRDRGRGLALGTMMGFLLHSSATTAMLVGFLHAGLITLAEAVPPIIGANLGTSLAMQLISFRVGDYWFLPVVIGVALRLSPSRDGLRDAGLLLVGFGLLFLSLNVMSGAVAPHREALAPLLAGIRGDTPAGLLRGFLTGLLATVVVQSSGALIGMCFALIQAGVFTALDQVFPLVLGAHVGTCSTALLASLGAAAAGRRAAVAHLLFNVIGSAGAAALAPLYYRLLPMTSGDLLHQTANLHTGVMLVTAAALLPLSAPLARLAAALVRTRGPEPEAGQLDESRLAYPEQALCAAIRELRRVARICAQSFHLNAELLFRWNRRGGARVERDEAATDEIQVEMKAYLAALAQRALSRRQSILIQHLNRCMIDIERIGDHNLNLAQLSERRHHDRHARFPRETLQSLFDLAVSAEQVLQAVIASLDPDRTDFQQMAREILQARDRYAEHSLSAKAAFLDGVARRELTPLAGIYLSEYVAEFDRIVRHSKMIALAESQPFFWIKRQRLDQAAPEVPPYPEPPAEAADDFLHKLQREGDV